MQHELQRKRFHQQVMGPLQLTYHWEAKTQADGQMLEAEPVNPLQRQRLEDVSFGQSTAIAPVVHCQLTSCHLRVFGNEDKVKKWNA
jgi:hypothetical protein